MYLTHLILRNFRNYAQASISLSPSVNLILGKNGQGKTNLLEAIYLVSTGRSFRTRQLSDLIRHGQRFFYVEAHFVKEGTTQSLKIYYTEKTRKIQYNSTCYAYFTRLLGILPGVLLCPEDHLLISGTPTERRRFLDIHIAQIDPLYVHHLNRYFRAMRQRNHLLRARDETTLGAWEEVMAHSGSYLMQKRREAMTPLQHEVTQWMQRLSCDKDALKMRYASAMQGDSQDLPAFLRGEWQRARERDMHLKMTLAGPHRDDLLFQISEKEAKHFSSEGQKRCAAASLRLAEWQHLKQVTGTLPLMGIDDFGLQLDLERQKLLQKQMQRLGQVFLTSPQHVQGELAHRCFHAEQGTVEEIG